MTYILTITYMDEEPIVDKYDEREDAEDAFTDARWAASNAPKSIYGDIRSVTLVDDDEKRLLRRACFITSPEP